jgi:hypothetical protein
MEHILFAILAMIPFAVIMAPIAWFFIWMGEKGIK